MLTLWHLRMKVVYILGVVEVVANWDTLIQFQCQRMKMVALSNPSQN
jgi:hypothetical protein